MLALLVISGRHLPLKIAAPAKQGRTHHGKFSKEHTSLRLHTVFNVPYVYDYITKLCRKQAEATQNHENDRVRSMRQGETRYIRYKCLKFGSDQVYNIQETMLSL
jgi:hypothetical protein